MRYPCFDDIEVSRDWAFENVRSTEQWTHGYHRYPAKFLPNVVKKIIEDHKLVDCVVADFFAGCGTTLVEAKVHGISSVGTDINPIATLITRVKTTPIEPSYLEASYNVLVEKFNEYRERDYSKVVTHERLDYWFRPEEKGKIAYLYAIVNRIEDVAIKEFFLVSISHILKNCSWWLQSSTKPQRDPHKDIPDPFESFKKHTSQMLRGNQEFYNELQNRGFLDVPCDISLADARKTPIADNSVDVVITSPPYVTSYEYADIHQLTGYWMEYFSDILAFRKQFIGTSYSDNRSSDTNGSALARKIVSQLLEKDKRMAYDVANYFNDMQSVANEMYRVVRKGGLACIVIGNTTYKDVHVRSAEVFFNHLIHAGFRKKNVIKRNIPNKLMPTLRDKRTGKFTTLDNKDCKQVYPDEYILIVKK